MIAGLTITHISIYPVSRSEGRLRALARVVLNDVLQLTNLRVYDGSNGLFVSYPVEFTQKGEEFRQIFYPVKKDFREYVECEVLNEYSNVLEKVV
ncbi:MAG: SpoVG family protein [Fibrobacterales bacterium]